MTKVHFADQWFTGFRLANESAVKRLTQRLAAHMQELEERYVRPLAELVQEVEVSCSKVEGHLQRMGLSWG